jgi:hypothetical protein
MSVPHSLYILIQFRRVLGAALSKGKIAASGAWLAILPRHKEASRQQDGSLG